MLLPHGLCVASRPATKCRRPLLSVSSDAPTGAALPGTDRVWGIGTGARPRVCPPPQANRKLLVYQTLVGHTHRATGDTELSCQIPPGAQIEKVLSPARPAPAAAGTAPRAAPTGAWMSGCHLPARQAAAPIRSSCSLLAGQPASSARWGLLPASYRSLCRPTPQSMRKWTWAQRATPTSCNVSLPGLEREVAQALVDTAHQTCPYSKATRAISTSPSISCDLNLRAICPAGQMASPGKRPRRGQGDR